MGFNACKYGPLEFIFQNLSWEIGGDLKKIIKDMFKYLVIIIRILIRVIVRSKNLKIGVKFGEKLEEGDDWIETL